jgi:hypothetical protein
VSRRKIVTVIQIQLLCLQTTHGIQVIVNIVSARWKESSAMIFQEPVVLDNGHSGQTAQPLAVLDKGKELGLSRELIVLV